MRLETVTLEGKLEEERSLLSVIARRPVLMSPWRPVTAQGRRRARLWEIAGDRIRVT